MIGSIMRKDYNILDSFEVRGQTWCFIFLWQVDLIVWMYQFDPVIKCDAKLYFRYMDDIMKDNKLTNMDQKLQDINYSTDYMKL